MTKIIEINGDVLPHKAIIGLAKGYVHALVLKNFYDVTLLSSVCENILKSPDKGYLNHAKEFEKIGHAYSEVSTARQKKLYHSNVEKNKQIIKNFFPVGNDPMEKFQLLLNNAWPKGARLLTMESQKCFAGICRILNPNINLDPHTDKIERNFLNQNVILESQLSANLYLKMPSTGGEVDFWDLEPSDSDYEKLKRQRHYGISRLDLPPPSATYKPNAGELLILNSRKIHAVKNSETERRITLSCFIAYFGNDEPLRYWS
ncbi:MAG: hypothetical protein WC785_06125 [Tatlockia sp.]